MHLFLALRPYVSFFVVFVAFSAIGNVDSDFTNLLHGLKFPDDAARHLGALPSAHVLADSNPGDQMNEA